MGRWLYMLIIFQSAIVHLWMQHVQNCVQRQFKWVHCSHAFLWLIFPIWYLWFHQLFTFPPDFTGWEIDTSEHQVENSCLEAFLTMIFPQLQLFLVVCQLAWFCCILWVILSLYTIFKKSGVKSKLYKKYNYIIAIWSFLVRLVMSWKMDFLERLFFCKINFIYFKINAIGSLAVLLFIVVLFNRV